MGVCVMAKKKGSTALGERLAIVILENVWWKLSDNPGIASAEPFFDGLSRHDDNVVCYRLPFYGKESLKTAVKLAKEVPHDRVLLHIGAHGHDGSIGGIRLTDLYSSFKSLKSTSGKKIEGVILSSCSAGRHAKTVEAAFQCGASWVFAYTVDVEWMGSVMIDLSLAEEVSLEPDRSYTQSAETLIESLSEGLRKFNPNWRIDGKKKGNEGKLANAIILAYKEPGGRRISNITSDLCSHTWRVSADSHACQI